MCGSSNNCCENSIVVLEGDSRFVCVVEGGIGVEWRWAVYLGSSLCGVE